MLGEKKGSHENKERKCETNTIHLIKKIPKITLFPLLHPPENSQSIIIKFCSQPELITLCVTLQLLNYIYD